jgi:hypothetical protein
MEISVLVALLLAAMLLQSDYYFHGWSVFPFSHLPYYQTFYMNTGLPCDIQQPAQAIINKQKKR